ncbi:MAG TPA: peptide ABC transporter substrate-binding protein [Candidatus Saccharimonadales bacterium]|nr:peptide ABC transporter substrate-binding protein [Candidatus Saccharimonadales bacterium]
MQTRLIRLRFRRGLRQRQRQMEGLSTQAEENINQHLLKRFNRLAGIRRFLMAWVGLLVLLIGGLVAQNLSLSGYFQTLQPVPGGIYKEGMMGRFTTANPLFVRTSADAAVSRLMFAGLLTQNQRGQLVGDLASDYSVDTHGTTYTVHLRPHLTWQDGRPLTSADVVFTFQSIENPDVQSPLFGSWQGIQVSATDASTVVFKLPDILASFPYNLTTGILPQHLLSKVPAVDLRSTDFNTLNPIGAGPFVWQGVQVSGNDPTSTEQQIGLAAFRGFHTGPPKLQKFIIQVYADQKSLIHDFKTGQLNAIAGVQDVPKSVKTGKGVVVHDLRLRAANMVFFKTSSGLLADKYVRAALVQAANVPAIINGLDYPTLAVREPLLPDQLAYNPVYVQAGFNLTAAKKSLDADGWRIGADGIRHKANQSLAFNLAVSDDPEYLKDARQLARQWHAAGADVTVRSEAASDFQNNLSQHDYDAILDGITIGTDPDVFVYWDSSQADIRSANRLNLSEYKNTTADVALEAGRTRLSPALRIIKYRPFLKEWQHDNPALGLYQPRLLYLTNGPVAGLTDKSLTNPEDRFNNVQNWEIRLAKVTD